MQIQDRIRFLQKYSRLGWGWIGHGDLRTKSNCHGTVVYLFGLDGVFSVWPQKLTVERVFYDVSLNKRILSENIIAYVRVDDRPGMIHPYFMREILRQDFQQVRRGEAEPFDVVSFWSKNFCGNINGPKRYSLEHSALWTPNCEGEIFHQPDSGRKFGFDSVAECTADLDDRNCGRKFYLRYHRLKK